MAYLQVSVSTWFTCMVLSKATSQSTSAILNITFMAASSHDALASGFILKA